MPSSTPGRQIFQRRERLSPGHQFTRAARVVVTVFELVGIPIAIWALLATLEQAQLAREETELTRQALQDQRISSAWQILGIPGGGSTGKKYALETLVNLSENVVSVDLGCRSTPVIDENKKLRCADRVSLNWIHLIGKARRRDAETIEFSPSLNDFQFDHADIAFSEITALALQYVNFSYAQLIDTTFRDSWLAAANFDNANLTRTKFVGSNLHHILLTNTDLSTTVFEDVVHSDVNISGSTLCRPDDSGNSAARQRDAAGYVCNPAFENQAFLDQLWFFDHLRPLDLYRLPPELMIEAGRPPSGQPSGRRVSVSTVFPTYRQNPQR